MKTSPVLVYSNRYKEILFDLIVKNSDTAGPCYVLYIGCGKGSDLERISLLDKDIKNFGMDISYGSLLAAFKKMQDHKDCYLIQAKGEDIPFLDNSFHIIIASEVIEHTALLSGFLKEALRVLRDDGIFIITTPSKYNYPGLISKIVPFFLKQSLRKCIYYIEPGPNVNPHFYEYTPQCLKKIFQDNGFIVETIIPGVMRVPMWILFERFPALVSLWKRFDHTVGRLPYGYHLKANFIITARKFPHRPQKILVINLGGIGDIMLSFPALKALRDSYPGAEIDMLITPKSYEIANRMPFINKIFLFNMAYGGIIPFFDLFKDAALLLRLRKQRFDIAVNMRTLASKKGAWKIIFLFHFISPGIKAGRDTEGRGYFFDVKIPETDIATKHSMEYDADIVEALGAKVGDRKIELDFLKKDVERLDEILASEGITGSDILVGLHPGGLPSRRWPVDNYSAVIATVLKKIPCKFVVTGGNNEVLLAKKLVKLTGGKCVSLAGKLTLGELCAFIKRCSLFISNDTGPMHVAAILKTSLIAIFGPGDIVRFDPRRISDKAVVFYKRADCAPCYRKNCDTVSCLRAILPEEVADKTSRLLGDIVQNN